MADRQVHRVFEMIAIHAGDRVLAVTQANFRAMVEAALPDLDPFQRISYLMTFSVAGAVMSRDHIKLVPLWDARLVHGIQAKMSDLGHLLTFKFGNDEAKKFLPDLLESYRGNHVGEFSWSLDEQLGEGKALYTVSTYAPPSLLERVTQRERAPLTKYVFSSADVLEASGTSMRFALTCKGFALGFAPNGNVLRTTG